MTNQNENKPPSSYQAQEAAKALVATGVAITQKPFLRYVTGSITNSSDHRISYLVVKLGLFDGSGKVVGDVSDAVLDFGPAKFGILKLVWSATTPSPFSAQLRHHRLPTPP